MSEETEEGCRGYGNKVPAMQTKHQRTEKWVELNAFRRVGGAARLHGTAEATFGAKAGKPGSRPALETTLRTD